MSATEGLTHPATLTEQQVQWHTPWVQYCWLFPEVAQIRGWPRRRLRQLVRQRYERWVRTGGRHPSRVSPSELLGELLPGVP